jgi:hypothetical protein
MGSLVLVMSRSPSMVVFGLGVCPGGPARALAVDLSSVPFRLLRLVDVSP